MRSARILAILCCATLALMFAPGGAVGDMIKFKRGGVQKCVIVEETEDSVRFLNSMGTVSTPLSRIESIVRESEEINNKLKEKWEKKKRRVRVEKPKPSPEPAKKEEAPVLRAYNVELTKRRISLGGRAAGIDGTQLVAAFIIKDLGMIEGKRLFLVTATSHRSGAHNITCTDFHALLKNGLRIDSETPESYDELDAALFAHETATGHVAFGAGAKLETLVLKSQVGKFELDLATGKFTSREGPF